MKLSDNDLKNLWQEETAPASRPDCLSTDLLARAGAGELRALERTRMAGHLAHCVDCATDYRLALAVKDWSLEAVAVQAEAFPVQVTDPPKPLPWWRRMARGFFESGGFSPLAAASAAALLVLMLALGGWLLRVREQNRTLVAHLNEQRLAASENAALRTRLEDLQRQQSELSGRFAQQQSAGQPELKAEIEKLKNELAEITRPQLDVPQIDVDPQGETRGAGSGGKNGVTTIKVPASAPSFTINLPGAGSRPFPHYLIELLDAKTNKTVWRSERKQDSETTFTLTLMKRHLPAGKYRILVSGQGGRKKELIARYAVQTIYQP